MQEPCLQHKGHLKGSLLTPGQFVENYRAHKHKKTLKTLKALTATCPCLSPHTIFLRSFGENSEILKISEMCWSKYKLNSTGEADTAR